MTKKKKGVRHYIFTLWRKCYRLFFFLFFIVTLSAAYLYFYGLPDSWKQAVLEELARRGVHLEIQKLYFDPLRGIVASKIQYKPNAQDEKTISVGEIALNIKLSDLIRKRFVLETVEVDGSNIEFDRGSQRTPVLIKKASGNVRFAKNGIVYLESIVGETFGIRLELNGRLDLTKSESSPTKKGSALDAEKIRQILTEINAVKADRPIEIRAHIDGRLAETKTLQARVEIHGGAASWHGWNIKNIEGKASFKNGILELDNLALKAVQGRINLNGSWNVEGKTAVFEFFSNINPQDILKDIPSTKKPRLLNEMTFQTPPEIWVKAEMNLSTPDSWKQSLKGDASFWIRNTSWNKNHIIESRGNLQIHDGRVDAPGLLLVQDFGRMTGNFGFEFVKEELAFDFTSTLDVSEVMKLLYPSDKNWFQNVRYTKPPLLQLSGTWKIRDPKGLKAKGRMNWEDWVANKVPIRSTQSDLTIDGRLFQFKNLKLIREEGRVDGDFSLNFQSQTAGLDLVSSIAFTEFTRLIGPKTEELFQPYHFLAPPRLQLKGIVDFGDNTSSDLWAHIECDKFKIWKLSAANVKCDVRSFRKSLEIANYSSEFYDGQLSGNAVFDFSTPAQDWTFNCQIQKADFDQFTHDLWDYSEVHGYMSGWVEMSGTMKSSREAKGRGEVKIDDGVLWKIPLFGELSSIPPIKFLPLVGEQKATKAYAIFRVEDEKAFVQDMKISAGVMSLTAKGIYKFDQSMDFIVQGHFLRAFFGIGYVFDPFTKAFEYHLGGKLQNRKWEPRFLPKELLPKFENNSSDKNKDAEDDSSKH